MANEHHQCRRSSPVMSPATASGMGVGRSSVGVSNQPTASSQRRVMVRGTPARDRCVGARLSGIGVSWG